MLKSHIAAVLSFAAIAAGAMSGSAFGQIIAQSGFNDNSGINSNPAPNTPFTIGQTIHNRGEGETGWTTLWAVSAGGGTGGEDHALALAVAAREGDGGLQIDPTPGRGNTRALRGFPSQSRSFSIDQDINFVAAGELYSRPGQGGGVPEPIGTGPQWRITGTAGDRHFEVADGTGDQIDHWENTGIAQLAGQWQHVTLNIDVATQTWTFAVDGTPYKAPDPLGFTGQPASIGYLEYLTTSSGWIDSVVVAAPEPSGVIVALGLVFAALTRSKRSCLR